MTTEQQLANLRRQYIAAKQAGDTVKMELLHKLANRIKEPPKDYFAQQVRDALGIDATTTDKAQTKPKTSLFTAYK